MEIQTFLNDWMNVLFLCVCCTFGTKAALALCPLAPGEPLIITRGGGGTHHRNLRRGTLRNVWPSVRRGSNMWRGRWLIWHGARAGRMTVRHQLCHLLPGGEEPHACTPSGNMLTCYPTHTHNTGKDLLRQGRRVHKGREGAGWQ